MPRRPSVTPELIRAISHPVRLRIFGALDRRPLTLTELSREIGEDRRCTLRHVRLLEQAGVIRSASGPAGRVYEATSIPTFNDDDYGALPIAMRRAAVAVCLARVQATAAGALDDGGFDRGDIHVSRTALTVDPDDWQRVADELAETLERLHSIRDDAEDDLPAADAVHATAVIMLFESGGQPPERSEGTAAFTREDALLRAWDLTEEVTDLLVPAEATDWTAIIERVDQLRVLASAAQDAEVARRTPSPEAAERIERREHLASVPTR
jgi:DNA-binding transcriptional ArsR family regulator